MRSLLHWSSIIFLLGLGLSLGWLINLTTAQSRPQAPHTVYDDAPANSIQFVNTGLLAPTPVPPGVGPALNINVQADRHPISPYIYGMNFADEDLAADLDLPVRRWGGNSTSRYNWQLNVHNTGSDWYFENIPDDSSGPLPGGSSTNQFVDQDRRTGTKTILTHAAHRLDAQTPHEQSSLRLRLQSQQVWRASRRPISRGWRRLIRGIPTAAAA